MHLTLYLHLTLTLTFYTLFFILFRRFPPKENFKDFKYQVSMIKLFVFKAKVKLRSTPPKMSLGIRLLFDPNASPLPLPVNRLGLSAVIIPQKNNLERTWFRCSCAGYHTSWLGVRIRPSSQP